jgi:hypothetical protein
MCEAKTCTKCGKTLPISEFNHRKIEPDGFMKVCRNCMKAYHRARYRKIHYSVEASRELMEELAKRGYTGKLHTQITKPWEKLSEALQSALKNEGLQGATVVLDKYIDITNF